ncbi:styrene monooxygenase/indole monooxygenase family protein [Amycolatopsis nigrescens]|uniref:styrene monooxygenase/indole monooxygenase family protein n=1 Tax=Amycolatopsis nigrescens TaxID=381445 RepID=UPI00036C0291|nr:styrene monooxygenase/indole monooxygenase family protein [Amycolatopsis nigrescens]
MARIAVIGAGRTGATMALVLLRRGHEVTLYSDRSAPDLLENTPATGTAMVLGEALAVEQRFGLDSYEASAPGIAGMILRLAPTVGVPALSAAGDLGVDIGRAVDTRLVSYDRMNAFTAAGGELRVTEVSVSDLDEVAAAHDLAMVATGKGGLSGLFERDPVRSGYTEPQRFLGMLTVTGIPLDGTAFSNTANTANTAHTGDGRLYNSFSVIGDTGEGIWCPYLHKTAGPCWSWLGFARMGTPWEEAFRAAGSAAEMLAAVKRVYREDVPWEWESIRDAEVIESDRLSWLKGAVLPSVRAAAGRTPGGRPVLSLGDSSLTFDPLGAQGAQCGLKQVGHYSDAISRHEGAFDADWMNATFEDFYARYAEPSMAHTRTLLEGAGGGEIPQLLFAAAVGDRRVADGVLRLLSQPQDAQPFGDTADLLAWISRTCDGEDAQSVLARAMAKVGELAAG